eukprot:Gb_13381 [translate_table: standard]
MRWSLHLASAPVSLLVLRIPLLVGHHVTVPQRVGGWAGPFGDDIISVGFGLPMGLQPLTPSISQFSYYPPSQRLPYSFTRIAFLRPGELLWPFWYQLWVLHRGRTIPAWSPNVAG